jgi:catechol 2,3-dioxygenase-like lactoylglutathione lyase family enzyme
MKLTCALGVLAVVVGVGGSPSTMAAQTRPAITGIAFVRMYSADAAASDAFYGKTLGFEKVMGVDGIARYGVNEAQWLEGEKLPANPPETRVAEIAFTTRDVKALQRYLVAHHVAIETGKHKDGFAVRDPEGNLIGFVQRDAMKGKLTMSSRATSRRIIHAGFVVHDRAVEDAFYRDLLGFKPYWHGGRTDDSTDYVSLQVPDGTDWVEYMLNSGPHPSAHILGVMNHFSLGVAHMSDATAALARNGCTTTECSKTQMGRDGKVQLNLYDPDLTRVEFMEFVPSGTTCCSSFEGRHPVDVEDR